MYTFDASSIVHAWDNYPIDIFPSLWNWIAERINESEFSMPQCAFEECGYNSPDCHSWLNCYGITRYPLTANAIQYASAIKASLNISGNSYHSKGVDENDLFIISTAKDLSFDLVSNEAIQPTLSPMLSKYKIPAVCNLSSVGVHCVSFVNLLHIMKPDLQNYLS